MADITEILEAVEECKTAIADVKGEVNDVKSGLRDVKVDFKDLRGNHLRHIQDDIDRINNRMKWGGFILVAFVGAIVVEFITS